MARILPDRDLTRLVGTCILEGDIKCIKTNSYELRLGGTVRFHGAGQTKQIGQGQYLEIQPGELVTVASLEKLDFSKEATGASVGDDALMGWITPTTTMVREGMLLHSTKVDAGFRGNLNWGIRNSTINPIRLAYGERLFKLTVMGLGPEEVPETPYGQRDGDYYQDSEGIVRSARQIPADIPTADLVRSDQRKIDPKKQLREAGYPFNHIGTELIELHGKFEIVSSDVKALTAKIEDETSSLVDKISQVSDAVLQKVEALISDRLLRTYAVLVAIASLGFAGYKALLQSAPSSTQTYVFLGVAALAFLFAALVPRFTKR